MKRVLVCEDEDSIREFVVINLVRSGYEVVDVNAVRTLSKPMMKRTAVLTLLCLIL